MTARKDEGPTLATPAPEDKLQTTGSSLPDEQKRFATLRARLALKGFELLETSCGKFTVSRWNLTRECGGLDEAEVFAIQAGVSPAGVHHG